MKHHPLTVAQGWAAWWLALAVAVGFAVAFHYLVDMPTQRWIRARRKGRAAKPANHKGLTPALQPQF